MRQRVNIFWFRRDLRLHDNAGLYHALRSGSPVLPIFIFDRNILDDLQSKDDRRVSFIYGALEILHEKLKKHHSSLDVYYGFPDKIFKELSKKYQVGKVFINRDYEPYATTRDDAVASILAQSGIELFIFKDQVIFDRDEVVKPDRNPYTVFGPYKRAWKTRLSANGLRQYSSERFADRFFKMAPAKIPPIERMGFEKVGVDLGQPKINHKFIEHYASARDFPGEKGTSRISAHLRFGTISLRGIVKKMLSSESAFLDELIWREFFQMILWHFPRLGNGSSFKPAFDRIRWRNDAEDFLKWCEGRTGYPLVDAGMRELNQSGFMHNRARMVTASFLVKHLLIDWRWGEAYFAWKLLDFDLASNNGNWQWVAGSGCDSAPYFRIFNPQVQAKKFDPAGKYIQKWVPEFGQPGYPAPMVDHDFARKRAIKAYAEALGK